jgi:hypothetical protein
MVRSEIISDLSCWATFLIFLTYPLVSGLSSPGILEELPIPQEVPSYPGDFLKAFPDLLPDATPGSGLSVQ